MEKEGGKLPFESTKEFVSEVYDELYQGELELPKSQIDFDKPYTQIGDRYYQAEFPEVVIGSRDRLPLVVLPITDMPDQNTPNGKRRPNATLLYVFADRDSRSESLQTLQQIGGAYGVTREMIRQDIKSSLHHLYRLSTSDIQGKFPFGTLETNRPLTLGVRIRGSEASGGSTIEIGELVEKGVSAGEINKLYGNDKLNGARKTLEKWGLKAPERLIRDFKPLIDKINDPSTFVEELCSIISQFDNSGLYRDYSKGENPILIPLSKLQQEVWGNKNYRETKVVQEILEVNNLPVNSVTNDQVLSNGRKKAQTYRFTLARTQDLAREVLGAYKDKYGHIPVTQVSGRPLESVPNTTLLFGTRKELYEKVSNYQIEEFVRSNPDVPVFKYKRTSRRASYYIPKQRSQ